MIRRVASLLLLAGAEGAAWADYDEDPRDLVPMVITSPAAGARLPLGTEIVMTGLPHPGAQHYVCTITQELPQGTTAQAGKPACEWPSFRSYESDRPECVIPAYVLRHCLSGPARLSLYARLGSNFNPYLSPEAAVDVILFTPEPDKQPDRPWDGTYFSQRHATQNRQILLCPRTDLISVTRGQFSFSVAYGGTEGTLNLPAQRLTATVGRDGSVRTVVRLSTEQLNSLGILAGFPKDAQTLLITGRFLRLADARRTAPEANLNGIGLLALLTVEVPGAPSPTACSFAIRAVGPLAGKKAAPRR